MEKPTVIPRENDLRKLSPEEIERTKIVKKVFDTYHKTLMTWCISRLKKYKTPNLRTDAEDVLAFLYEKLLSNEESIDLTMKKPEIEGYLNKALDFAVSHFLQERMTQKRMPEGGLVSWDKILETTEPSLPANQGEEFEIFRDNKETKAKIKQALLALEQRSEKEKDERKKKKYKLMAEIVRKRYYSGEDIVPLQEIADSYGLSKNYINIMEHAAIEKIRKFLRFGKI